MGDGFATAGVFRATRPKRQPRTRLGWETKRRLCSFRFGRHRLRVGFDGESCKPKTRSSQWKRESCECGKEDNREWMRMDANEEGGVSVRADANRVVHAKLKTNQIYRCMFQLVSPEQASWFCCAYAHRIAGWAGAVNQLLSDAHSQFTSR